MTPWESTASVGAGYAWIPVRVGMMIVGYALIPIYSAYLLLKIAALYLALRKQELRTIRALRLLGKPDLKVGDLSPKGGGEAESSEKINQPFHAELLSEVAANLQPQSPAGICLWLSFQPSSGIPATGEVISCRADEFEPRTCEQAMAVESFIAGWSAKRPTTEAAK